MRRHLSRLTADRGTSHSLLFVMGLPLLDGVFPTLVVAGALGSVVGVVQVGLLVFGGAATAALLLSSTAGRRHDTRRVLRVAAVVVPVAAVEAAFAPPLTVLLDASTFRPFAGLVLLAVAARVASAHVTRYLPAPGLFVLVGVVVSFNPAPVTLSPDVDAALRGVAAALVGVTFALAVVAGADRLRRLLDTGRFRFGSAVALGTMGASVAGLVPTDSPLPLVALVLAALLSIDPLGERPTAAGTAGGDPDETSTEESDTVSEQYP
ncbi:MAG: DUF5794 domain-containing protein [Halobacteriaceae archaeon]